MREAQHQWRKTIAGLTAVSICWTTPANAFTGEGVPATAAIPHPANARDPGTAAAEADPASPRCGVACAGVSDAAESLDAPAWDVALVEGGNAISDEALVVAQAGGSDAAGGAAGSVEAGPAQDRGAVGTEPAGSRKFAWTLAPIRWGGNLAAELRMTRFAGQERRLQQVESGNLRLGSYIWQPWFAQVAGGIGFVTSREHGSSTQASTGLVDSGNDATALTGNAALVIFPVSRFPFQATFDVTDSRASGEITSNDYRSKHLGLRQSYRPLRGNEYYTASYDRSTLTSNRFARDTVDVLAAEMTKTLGVQTFNLSGSHTRNSRGAGEGSTLNRITGQHSYRPDSTLSVTSLASASSSEYRLANNNLLTDSGSRFLQLNTFATWRPEEGDPLFVTAGARVFQSEIDSNGAQSESRSISGNVAASYALSRNTNVTGNASVTQVATDAGDNLFTSQGAGVAYSADPRKFGNYIHTWNANTSVTNVTGGAQGTQQQISGLLGQGLTRFWAPRENSNVTLNLGQSLGATYDTLNGQSQTLTHNATLSWRYSPAADKVAYFSLAGADARTFGYNENEFQLINAQATGQIQFSRYAFGAANYTIQGTRQETPSAPAGGFNVSSYGSLSYQHARAFGVPRLRYWALYTANETQFKSRLQGDVTATRETVTQSFEQRLDYNIGRLEMRLTMRVADVDGQRNYLVFFRVSRQFGDF